ncbi:transposase family protein, partial [Streptomyces litchfieldiae]|uniref:transposase family protein n=1 Tax=Streptomyces litchfieldiae TaxID=3075543 RepID=UPI00374E04A9
MSACAGPGRGCTRSAGPGGRNRYTNRQPYWSGDNYSGKRRRAGLNVQVAATTDGELVGVSTPFRGSIHDRRAFAESGWEALTADTAVIA